MSAPATKKPLPPYPKEKHWLFGSGYLLKDDTINTVKGFIERYGDAVSLSIPFSNIVIAANPEYARHILVDNNRNYRKSLAYDILKLLLGNGLLTSEGDFWKKQRKLIQPAFHKQKLAALTAMMVERAEDMVKQFEAPAQSGEYKDMAPDMTDITLDIISKAIFSSGVGDKAARIRELITQLNQQAIEKLNQPLRLPPALPTPFNLRWKKAVAELDSIIYGIIDARRKEGVSKDDLLSMLLDARDEETGEAMDNLQLRDEIMTIFIAGNETSANALTWILYLLSQNPDAQAKLVNEIDTQLNNGTALTFENVMQHFTYTRMVIDESMRLYPPAWSIGRRNYEEDHLGPYRLRPNTNVIIPIIYFHHSPAYWTEPEKFMPERFAPELRNKIDRFVYFPFGGGPRLCIGNHFALLEMAIILIQLYRHYTFSLQPGFTVEPEPLITLRPRYGMVMQVKKRS